MAILLFANGDVSEFEQITPYLDQAIALIGVDGGTRHISALGRVPDVVIGDLDSINPADLTGAKSAGAHIERFPAEKDETDLELALRFVADRPEWDTWPIYIFGAIGNRLDQTLANVFLLAHPKIIDRTVRLIEGGQMVWLTRNKTIIHGRVGDTISLLPIGGDVYIESTHGLKWPLMHEKLSFGPARGISNVLIEPKATITVADHGFLLVSHAFEPVD